MTAADEVTRGEQLAKSGRFTGTQPEPWPDEPPPDEELLDVEKFGDDAERQDDEPTSWEPIDLGPYLRGEITQPEPTIGAVRSDGQRFLYPGREHAVLGETESGKTWLALACVAAELVAGHPVLYLHYEESDAASTVERLRLLGVAPDLINGLLRFVAPSRPVRTGWLAELLDPEPSLVVHDGVNEAMALHGKDVLGVEGAAGFRRLLVTPFLKAGAATLACDHVPKNSDGKSRDAYGTVHKGNAINGSRIMLENVKPFGYGLRGVSHVFVTKDRPGRLRVAGKPSQIPGKTFFGTLVVDDSPTSGADFLGFYAPKDDDNAATKDPAAELGEIVAATIAEQPDGSVASSRQLFALLRQAGHQVRDTRVRAAVDDLIVAGRLIEVRGKNNSLGYKASASESGRTAPPGASASVPRVPYREGRADALTQGCVPDEPDAPGRTGTHSGGEK